MCSDATKVLERFADEMEKRVGQVHLYEPFNASRIIDRNTIIRKSE